MSFSLERIAVQKVNQMPISTQVSAISRGDRPVKNVFLPHDSTCTTVTCQLPYAFLS